MQTPEQHSLPVPHGAPDSVFVQVVHTLSLHSAEQHSLLWVQDVPFDLHDEPDEPDEPASVPLVPLGHVPFDTTNAVQVEASTQLRSLSVALPQYDEHCDCAWEEEVPHETAFTSHRDVQLLAGPVEPPDVPPDVPPEVLGVVVVVDEQAATAHTTMAVTTNLICTRRLLGDRGEC